MPASTVSASTVSATQQSLVGDGLAERRVETGIPPSVYYRLTGLGLSLEVPLAALRDWAEEHMAEVDQNNLRQAAPMPASA